MLSAEERETIRETLSKLDMTASLSNSNTHDDQVKNAVRYHNAIKKLLSEHDQLERTLRVFRKRIAVTDADARLDSIVEPRNIEAVERSIND